MSRYGACGTARHLRLLAPSPAADANTRLDVSTWLYAQARRRLSAGLLVPWALKRPHPPRRHRLAGAMYAWVAAFGYLTFGSTMEEELWASYQRATSRSDALVGTVRLGFFVSILCTVPLILFPLRMCAAAAEAKGGEEEGPGPAQPKPAYFFWRVRVQTRAHTDTRASCEHAPIGLPMLKAHPHES